MKQDSLEEIDLPTFHPCITASDDMGHVKNKLRLKAAQVHVFMRISQELITPLLGAHVNDPTWQAWLAHVKYFNSMMASSFTRYDIKRLDDEIQAHQLLYSSLPGAHFVPKHHFARHVPKDILRNGVLALRNSNADLLGPLSLSSLSKSSRPCADSHRVATGASRLRATIAA